jgi:hypothetical protein
MFHRDDNRIYCCLLHLRTSCDPKPRSILTKYQYYDCEKIKESRLSFHMAVTQPPYLGQDQSYSMRHLYGIDRYATTLPPHVWSCDTVAEKIVACKTLEVSSRNKTVALLSPTCPSTKHHHSSSQILQSLAIERFLFYSWWIPTSKLSQQQMLRLSKGCGHAGRWGKRRQRRYGASFL